MLLEARGHYTRNASSKCDRIKKLKLPRASRHCRTSQRASPIRETEHSSTSLPSLPLVSPSPRLLADNNLRENCMLKAAILLVKNSWTTVANPEIEVCITLASVCRLWWETLTKRQWVAQVLKHHLTKLCSPFTPSVQTVATLDTRGCGVTGITHLDYRIYITCVKSRLISVYYINDCGTDTHQLFSCLDDIRVKRMRNPNDMAACAATGHLYIVDYTGNCVWKVKPGYYDDYSNLEHTIVKWSNIRHPWSISVDGNGQILVTQIPSEQLTIFDNAGMKKTIVKFPGIEWPRHAIQTLSGTWIVCHGRSDRDDNRSDTSVAFESLYSCLDCKHRICEVSRSKDILDAYGGQRGQGVEQLDTPRHLAMDKDGKHVFVVDWHNSRVLEFLRRPHPYMSLRTTSTRPMTLHRVLLDTSKSRTGPRRVCFVEETGQLLVGMQGEEAGIHVLNLFV